MSEFRWQKNLEKWGGEGTFGILAGLGSSGEGHSGTPSLSEAIMQYAAPRHHPREELAAWTR